MATRQLARFAEARVSNSWPMRALHAGTRFLTFARMLAPSKRNGGDDGNDDGHGSNGCTHNWDTAERDELEEEEEPRQRARERAKDEAEKAEKDATHREIETKTKDKKIRHACQHDLPNFCPG